MKNTVSFRFEPQLLLRINALAKATRLKKTAILEMCIEDYLPALEKKYAGELAKQGGTNSAPKGDTAHRGSGDTERLDKQVVEALKRDRKNR